MSIQFNPLSASFYQIPKAQILFQPLGSLNFALLGDADSVTIDMKVELTERHSNELGTKQLTASYVTFTNAVLSMTLVQLTDLNRALSLMGDVAYDTQPASNTPTMTLTAPLHDGSVYQLVDVATGLPCLDVGTVVVEDDSIGPVVYVKDVDYKLDPKAGLLQLINKHAAASGNVVVTWHNLVIVAADLRARIGLAQNTTKKGKVIIRGTNDVGPQTYIQLHSVLLRPSSARGFIEDKNLTTLKIDGAVFVDPTQPVGYQLGFERALLPST